MLVNALTLGAVFLNLRIEFNRAFAAAPTQWARVAMRAPSTSAQNDYKWLSEFPRMRRWIGDKNVKSLEGFSYTVVNEDWETTVEVDRNHIEDDTLGIYAPQAQSAGFAAAQFPDELVFSLFNFTGKGFDGLTFFATTHKVAGASVSNKGTAALSVATQAAAIASYGAARTAMRKFKDDEGRPLNVMPDTLVVPPALEDAGNALLTGDRLEDGKVNLYKGTAQLLVVPWLTTDTEWYLLDTGKPVKPFIYQERKAPEFVQQTDPQADDVFMRRKFKYGAEARAAGGYGFWQLAYGSTGAG